VVDCRQPMYSIDCTLCFGGAHFVEQDVGVLKRGGNLLEDVHGFVVDGHPLLGVSIEEGCDVVTGLHSADVVGDGGQSILAIEEHVRDLDVGVIFARLPPEPLFKALEKHAQHVGHAPERTFDATVLPDLSAFGAFPVVGGEFVGHVFVSDARFEGCVFGDDGEGREELFVRVAVVAVSARDDAAGRSEEKVCEFRVVFGDARLERRLGVGQFDADVLVEGVEEENQKFMGVVLVPYVHGQTRFERLAKRDGSNGAPLFGHQGLEDVTQVENEGGLALDAAGVVADVVHEKVVKGVASSETLEDAVEVARVACVCDAGHGWSWL
jgi:hypothetical protein